MELELSVDGLNTNFRNIPILGRVDVETVDPVHLRRTLWKSTDRFIRRQQDHAMKDATEMYEAHLEWQNKMLPISEES